MIHSLATVKLKQVLLWKHYFVCGTRENVKSIQYLYMHTITWKNIIKHTIMDWHLTQCIQNILITMKGWNNRYSLPYLTTWLLTNHTWHVNVQIWTHLIINSNNSCGMLHHTIQTNRYPHLYVQTISTRLPIYTKLVPMLTTRTVYSPFNF